mgnify:CR=1 FL=1
MGESQSRGTRLSADAYGSYTKDFGDLSLKAIVGVALVDRTSKAIATSTKRRLVFPFFIISPIALRVCSIQAIVYQSKKDRGIYRCHLGI